MLLYENIIKGILVFTKSLRQSQRSKRYAAISDVIVILARPDIPLQERILRLVKKNIPAFVIDRLFLFFSTGTFYAVERRVYMLDEESIPEQSVMLSRTVHIQ